MRGRHSHYIVLSRTCCTFQCRRLGWTEPRHAMPCHAMPSSGADLALYIAFYEVSPSMSVSRHAKEEGGRVRRSVAVSQRAWGLVRGASIGAVLALSLRVFIYPRFTPECQFFRCTCTKRCVGRCFCVMYKLS